MIQKEIKIEKMYILFIYGVLWYTTLLKGKTIKTV